MRRKKLANKIMSILMSAMMLVSTPMSTLAIDVEVQQAAGQVEVQTSSEDVEDLSESADQTEEVQDEEIISDEGLIYDGTEEQYSDPEEEVILGDDEVAEPMQTFTDEGEETADVTPVSATVSYAAQAEGAFLMAPQTDVKVSSDLAESYGYMDQVPVNEGVSALDVLVAAHQDIFGTEFKKEDASSYLQLSGNFISTIWGTQTGNVGFLVNGVTPNKDETGDAVNQAKVTDGDEIDFYVYQDTSTWSDNYIWLEDANGSKLDGQTVTAGTTLELYVKGYSPFSYGMKEDSVIREHTSGIASAALQLVDMTSGSCTAVGAVSDESGKISVQIPKDWQGTYWLTAQGTKTIMALAKVQVDAAPVSDAINLSSLEIAIGGNTEDSKNVQTFAPAFDGKVTDYSTDVLDYQSDEKQRFVWVKASAPEGVTMTAKCEDSKSATLANGEWTMLYTEKTEGNWWDPQIVQVGSLQPNKFNKLTITVSKEGETDKTYTVELPMNPDVSNRSLAWKTNLNDAVYFTQNTENAALSVEAEYKNRPLKNEDEVTYQWYKNTENSTEGAVAIDGATDAVYKPDVSALGTAYYYVIASCAGLDSLTSQVIKVTVSDKKAPASVTLKCDYPYTIPDDWVKALDGKDYVAKAGDTLQLKAVDENGEETPVVWKDAGLYGGTLDASTGLYTITGNSNSYLKAVSLYDSSIQSEEKCIQIKDYTINQYYKNKSVTLSQDGQSATEISTQGGIAGYTLWTYKMSEDSIADLTSDLATKPNGLYFNVKRPGTIEASFDLDLDGDGVADGNGLTDSATLTINGIAVEDADGKLTKTYLETSTANPNPTMQLHALSSTENAAFTWSSTDDTVATVNEDGVVTAQGVGTVIISAKDGTYTGGIKLVVTNADKPYFEKINFASGWGPNGIDGWTTTTFKPDTLNYTGIKIRAASKNSLTLDKTTEYNAEHDLAVASYTDDNGEKQEIEINSGAQTILPGIPFETSTITITLTDRTDSSKQTVYTFEVTRPRDTVKTIGNAGITFTPEGRELWKDLYDGKKEGTMYVANEDGSLGQYSGVSASRYYYRTYAMNALESFKLTLKGTTAYTHIRYSTDDGTSWTYLGQSGTTGVATNSITFDKDEQTEGNLVTKVTIQILDDATYVANIAAEKDGYDGDTATTYTVWVEQIPVISEECDMVTATTDQGDWYPEFDSARTDYRIITAPGADAPKLTYTVSEGATVTVNNETQTPDEDGRYTLELTRESQNIVIAASNHMTEKTYSIGYSQRESDLVPDKVVDYLSVNSQYTNGNNGGYGVHPELTLTGNSLLSLGNFGGYVTYYYKNGLTDDPSHAYGVDFYVDGNAFKDTTTGTGVGSMEPGQVWVSENGSTWYALAGSEHYEDSTLWNYEVNYAKTETGGTTWTDNRGNSSKRTFEWPKADIYTMNTLPTLNSFTLRGIVIPCIDGTITGNGEFTSFSKGARFGYVDTLVNGRANPYLDNSDYSNASSGFDLEWAVDAAGNPVNVSGKSFHYVKVVTASNIIAGSANEKSTEVSKVVRAEEQGSAVGKTAAPTGVTFANSAKSVTVPFEDGKQIYEIDVPGMDAASILVNGTSEDDNIYINNQRVVSGTASAEFQLSTDTQKLVRIIVQNGEKEPVIYLLKLKSVPETNTLKGSGTQEDPWQIATAEDYQKVYNLVADGQSFEGQYLKQMADITLPADWQPIGVTRDGSNNINSGKNLNAFSGSIDGNNQTLTIPENGLPLLGYVKGAEVKNLNIYGKKIAGYGLVNNFEGVGLKGSAIVIDHVTLKEGSSTLKSGLIGANLTTNQYAGASGTFTATIRNCTIEKGVVIGYDKDQDMIGSIAGRLNGTVENCVSYADVYGKNYVGGILGTRDNSMGECAVSGSRFMGTVTASGEHAGGIVGGGYSDDSAPNAIRISVNDCSSDGDIIGKDKVGGILGGDSIVAQAWNAYTFRNNSFAGTVKATEGTYVGGIIGYYRSLNKLDDISGNEYSENCGTEKGIGFVAYLDTNYANPTVPEGTICFNTENGTSGCPKVTGCRWKSNYQRTDDPFGKDAEKIAKKGIKVTFSLLGDKKHESDKDGEIHTLADNNLTVWVPETVYCVNSDATVYDVLKEAAEDYGFELIADADNTYGTIYVKGITMNGLTLSELDNGPGSGWMDVINGIHPDVGVSEQTLNDGDIIIFHYTDDYTREESKMYDQQAADNVIAAINAFAETGSLTLADKAAVEAARAEYNQLTDAQKALVPAETLKKLTDAESKIAELEKNAKPDTPSHVHAYGEWTKISDATVFAPEKQERTCSCGAKETRDYGSAMQPTIKVNATTVPLKVKQKTSAFKVTGLANGDSVQSYKSSNTKLFTVTKSGVLKAGKKTGKATLTITLASGLQKKVTVKVQKKTVATSKITGLQKKVTLKKGAKLTLAPSRTPITSTQKFTYKSSNKKIATVSSKGVIKGKKAGKAKITVKSGKKKYTVTVTVTK